MQHLHREDRCRLSTFLCFYLFSFRPLKYLHGRNLEVGLPVEAVGDLKGRRTLNLPHSFQRDHIQLELGDQIKTCKNNNI